MFSQLLLACFSCDVTGVGCGCCGGGGSEALTVAMWMSSPSDPFGLAAVGGGLPAFVCVGLCSVVGLT